MSSSVVYKSSPKTMFTYGFGAKNEYMTHCYGIVTYQSAFISSDSPGLKERIISVTPISDLQSA
jgi:hypothetical protein